MSHHFVVSIQSPVIVVRSRVGLGLTDQVNSLTFPHTHSLIRTVLQSQISDRCEENTDLPLILQSLLTNMSSDMSQLSVMITSGTYLL